MTDAYFEAWRGGVVDTMIGIPATAEQRKREHYDRFASQILDKEAREQFTFPAQYMFKDVPDFDAIDDPVALLVAEMDRFNVRWALLYGVLLAIPVGAVVAWKASPWWLPKAAMRYAPRYGVQLTRLELDAPGGDGVHIRRLELTRDSLHVAARGGFTPVCASLLAAGADANARDSRGSTPLMAAAASGSMATV